MKALRRHLAEAVLVPGSGFPTSNEVVKVVSGYAGGASPNPSYEAVCNRLTGHAEVVQIEYDPGQTDLRTLLDWFWRCHDPTTLNRRGADVNPSTVGDLLPMKNNWNMPGRPSKIWKVPECSGTPW